MLQVQKVRVTWVRQVSPVRLLATFTDAATSHPFFFGSSRPCRRSGITGRRGVRALPATSRSTGGEMAVFLARVVLARP